MTAFDRRSLLTGMLRGAAVVTVGIAVMPKAAVSMSLPANLTRAIEAEDLVEKAQVVVVGPRRRRRRWVCWWRRGRRVCGWRWTRW